MIFQRQILLTPGYHHPAPSYSIHPMHLGLVLKYPSKGPVQLALELDIHTGWYPSTVKDRANNYGWTMNECLGTAHAWDVKEHVCQQTTESQFNRPNCAHLDGAACWCTGWSYHGDEWFKLLVDYGPGPVWVLMEQLAEQRVGLLLQAQQEQAEWVQALGY
jgi:hypothetical protein